MVRPTPEHHVLLCCAGVMDEASRDVRLREALGQVAHWRRLLRAALRHGVLPSLCRCLSQTVSEALPPGFLQEIQGLAQTLRQRNLRITGELLQLLGFLEGHGVLALPFKGPVLAQVAYGDVARRRFVDLDLLVRRADMSRVKEVLLSRGYSLSHAFTPRQEEAHLRYACEFSLSHPRKTMLDVHWRFAADFLGGGPDPEAVLARRVPVDLLGRTIFTLAPEDHLLVLCLHGASHLWSNLGMISDLAHLVASQPEWDWGDIFRRAQAQGMKRMVLLGLYLAWSLLEAPVPAEIIHQAKSDPVVTKLSAHVQGNLFTRTGETHRFGEINWFLTKVRERLQDKVNYYVIRTLIPTVEDWRWVSLPDPLFLLYYLLRPFRLVHQGLVLPLWPRRPRASNV